MFRSLCRLATVNKVFSKIQHGRKPLTAQPSRASSSEGWLYRQGTNEPKKFNKYASEAIMAFMWYWIMFHLYYDGEHFFGHFPYPDRTKWTDAELGIPPLEED